VVKIRSVEKAIDHGRTGGEVSENPRREQTLNRVSEQYERVRETESPGPLCRTAWQDSRVYSQGR
jgi:hypothetical protein